MRPTVIQKKWGHERLLHNGDYCMKEMHLRPGFQCSIHRHPFKDETFYVVAGTMLLELGEEPDKLAPNLLRRGQHIRVPPSTWHRFSNYADKECIFIEASTYDDPDDCERHTESGRIGKG